MKKGIRCHDVTEKELENACRICVMKDIPYIQLVLNKSVRGFEFGKFTESYANKIKEQIGNAKIAILGSYINPSTDNQDELRKGIDVFKENIRYASILKPIAVGTETGIYKEGLNDTEEAYQHLLKTLKILTKEAEKYSVCIGIEGVHCFVINTPNKMKRLIDDLDSDNVKVIFDPVNFLNINNYKEQNSIIEETFNLLSDRICVLHAKDFTIENGKFKNAKTAEGLLNYKLIFQYMKTKNLDIPIICEEISDTDAVVAFEKLEKILVDL